MKNPFQELRDQKKNYEESSNYQHKTDYLNEIENIFNNINKNESTIINSHEALLNKEQTEKVLIRSDSLISKKTKYSI